MTRPLPHAAFLDRDGTINVKQPPGSYVTSVSEFQLLDGAAEAIRLLNEQGIPVIVVTNQRGVALGVMSEHMLAAVHDHMKDELGSLGARIDAIYHCPHDIGACSCRKPEVGLFLEAQRDFPQLVLARCAVVGDSVTDIEAGKRLGATTVKIGEVRPQDVREASKRREGEGDYVAASLLDAVKWLLA